MNEIILKQLGKSSKKHEVISGIIKGITMSRNVSSTKCALYVPGNAKLSSKIKRIERCYAQSYIESEDAIRFLCNQFAEELEIVCSLDRTNWSCGNNDINALVLYGKGMVSCGMMNLKLLDNQGGSSNFEDRKEVLESAVTHMRDRIRVLLCDREFFSFEFVDYLITEDLPFVIRIKKSLKCAKQLLKNLGYTGKTITNVRIGEFKGKDIHLDVSAKKIKDDYLIVVSYKVTNPLKVYRKRWQIECFFKSLKTAGFNIENTKITALKRLLSLFLFCGMAYAFCIKLGLWIHLNVEKIKFKKTLNCYQFSFFRYGLDWLTKIGISSSQSHKLLPFFSTLTYTVR